jgi:hypothetical protein
MNLNNLLNREHSIFGYLLVVAILTFIGVLLRYFFSIFSLICEKKDIVAIYSDYITQDLIRINNSFISILISNTRTACIFFVIPCILVILIVGIFPYLVKLEYIITKKDNLIPVTSYFPLAKVATFFFYIALGFNSFSDLFCLTSLLPIQFLVLQFVHGIPEFLAFFLAACLGLKSYDDIKKFSDTEKNISLAKILPIFKDTLKKYSRSFLIIILIIIAAACIEVWVTPQIWIITFENYFIANNITFPYIN